MLTNLFYLNEQGKRKNLEDSLYPLPGKAKNNSSVFLVCDGVGGESKGEEASRIVCETMGATLEKQKGNITADILEKAAAQAVTNLQAFAEENPVAQNMSTTLTVACFQKESIWVGWCGDSRVYHIRNGKVLWRSKDHSLVQQLIETGDIATEEEAMSHPQKNVILRSLSAGNSRSKIETHLITDVQKNDYILLCTDGILENIGDQELYEILNPEQKKDNKAKLFLNYCEGKTNDNFSLYLLQLGKDYTAVFQKSFLNLKVIFLILTVLIAAIISYFFFSSKQKKQDNLNDKKGTVLKHIDTTHKADNSVPLPQLPNQKNRNDK